MGLRTRRKGGLCLPSLALQHIKGSHVPFFWRLVLQNQRGNWRKLPAPQQVWCFGPSHMGLDLGLGDPRVASSMLQSLIFCVETSSPCPPNLSFGARIPLAQTAPSMEELHQETASFQPTVLASPPPSLTCSREQEPSSPRWQRLPGLVQCGPTSFPVPACFLQLALTQQHHSVDACKLLRNVNCAVLKLRS